MTAKNISLIELCDSISEECKVLGARDRYASRGGICYGIY